MIGPIGEYNGLLQFFLKHVVSRISDCASRDESLLLV